MLDSHYTQFIAYIFIVASKTDQEWVVEFGFCYHRPLGDNL